MSKQAYKRVRRALELNVNREPLPAFAWPGGYPIIYLFADGGVICPECVNENISEIDGAMRDATGNRPHSSGSGGWALCAAEVYWEEEPDGPMVCDHCGKQLESAYGAPEPGDESDWEQYLNHPDGL